METPLSYIPTDRRHAMAVGHDLPERTEGAGLFADISGFTPLTEMLARVLGPRRGAEELTVYLNQVYDALIAELHRYGGSVLGFSGDAITCWFDADDGRRAVATALAMQHVMGRFSHLEITGGGSVALAMKAAIAVGPVRRFVVGDPSVTLVDVMAGQTLDRLAAAEHAAERGEVILDEASALALGDQVAIAMWRVDVATGDRFAIVADLRVTVPETPWPPLAAEALSDAQIRPWLLPAVYQRLQANQGEFLAELRPAVALFLRFTGIDYDGDADAPAKLNRFIQQVLHVLAQVDGSLIQLTVGDKGSYLYAVFGAPIAHEDDVDRAATAALALQEIPGRLAFLEPVQIGITLGRMRVGAYGGVDRRTYGVLGDATNLAARLMQAAPPGTILVSDEAQPRASRTLQWEKLPAIRVKGKSEPIAIHRLVGLRTETGARLLEPHYTLPMVGRTQELARVRQQMERVQQGQGQIVAITAEAGMGKSRLAAEVIQLALRQPLTVVAGEAQSYGTRTSYLAWQNIWRGLFGLDAAESAVQQIAQVEAWLQELNPALLPRLPLLGRVLNLPIPENDLTTSLDAKLRKTAREGLLLDVLRARAQAEPLMLVLDDCHWLDPMSSDLLTVLGRAVANLPVLILLLYRPLDASAQLRVAQLPHFTEITLTEFTPAEAERLIALKLGRLFGPATPVPPELVAGITARAGGNPFFIDELVNYLHDQGIRPADSSQLTSFDLPTSLHSLILSRIDRLNENQKAVIKVASVIGRLFHAAVLLGVYPHLGDAVAVNRNLAVLSDLELTPLDTPDPELVYIFKHVVTQEVAYESLLYRTRARLHDQIGLYLERQAAGNPGQAVHLLAFHFDRSDNEDKKREYLVKAGQAAQADYANATAVDYYLRALPLLSGIEHVVILRQLGQVHEIMGDWEQAEARYQQALAQVIDLHDIDQLAWCETALAELYRKRGQYDLATSWLQRARTGFTSAGNQDGVAKTLICAGTLASQQGAYDQARDLYQQSLVIRQALDDPRSIANVLNNLGVVARRQGDLAGARSYQEESLALRRALNDRWAIAMSLNNLGNVALDQAELAEARQRLEEAVAMQREIGDKWAIGNALNNLGNVARSQGDVAVARAAYQESLAIYGDLYEKWALSYLFEDIGWLLAQLGQAQEALQLVGAASALRAEIRAPLTSTEAAALDDALAPARRVLSEPAQAAATQSGAALSLTEAILLATAALAN